MLLSLRLSEARHPKIMPHKPAWHVSRCALVLVIMHFLMLFWGIAAAQTTDRTAEGKVIPSQPKSALDQATKPLQFGILPSLSTITLMRNYAPLKSYLEKTLKREVIISTAPNFPEYIRRTGANEYDFILTAPHFAKLTEDRQGFTRLARIQEPLRGVFLVAQTSPYQKIAGLRDKTLAIRDNLAMVTLLGEQQLAGMGLQLGRDINVTHSPSHTSAALSVVHGAADVALISELAFRLLPSEDKNQLRVLAYTQPAPNIMFMANPRLGKNETLRLRDALLHFNDDQINSASFTQNTGYSAIGLISEPDMRFLIPFVTLLQQRLPQELQ